MVDSRQKGARAEAALKKLLRDKTGLNFQRTPGSGALNETHKLKGDLYIPNEKNRFCIEVKHYKDNHLTSKILTDKTPQLLEWWRQAVSQADKVEMQPLLIFKYDRSKWFMATYLECVDCKREVTYAGHEDGEYFSIYLLEDMLNSVEKINWIL